MATHSLGYAATPSGPPGLFPRRYLGAAQEGMPKGLLQEDCLACKVSIPHDYGCIYQLVPRKFLSHVDRKGLDLTVVSSYTPPFLFPTPHFQSAPHAKEA